MIGQSIRTLVPPERRQESEDIMQRLAEGHHLEHFETVRSRKDGRRIDVSITVSPVRDADGKIIGASTIARDITERKQAEEQQRVLQERILALATTDPVTELPNHRALLARLDQELERAQRYERACSLLFLELDHFKALNDGYGHAAGDAVLLIGSYVLCNEYRHPVLLAREAVTLDLLSA